MNVTGRIVWEITRMRYWGILLIELPMHVAGIIILGITFECSWRIIEGITCECYLESYQRNYL